VRVTFVTHGCRLNRAESDACAGRLRAAGHEVVDDAGQADVAVLRSCSITAQADADARAALRRLRRRHPHLRLVATGCWATAAPQAAAPLADAVVSHDDGDRLIAAVLGLDPAPTPAFVPERRLRVTARWDEAAIDPRRARALLKVQDGCDYRCAFCIVPHVRGPSRSLGTTEIVRQLERLVEDGAREVVLTGVHLGTWGRDLRPRARTSDLVAALLPHLGPARLRMSSIDPHEVDDDLLAIMAAHPDRVCRHLHLPVQSGDDGVLRRMRRGHDAASFADLCARAAAAIPGLAVGVDVIAGFPGEDPRAFARTLALIDRVPVAYVHAFPYSPRAGTPAADWADDVGAPVRRARVEQLRALSQRRAADFAAGLAGREVDLVLHRRPAPAGGERIGVTDHYVELAVDGPAPPGARVRARVDAHGRRARVVGA
jgi:threonylcarbamoyladenosine tRNA methylthiotransferase MtaB